jgi:hypothetical protein
VAVAMYKEDFGEYSRTFEKELDMVRNKMTKIQFMEESMNDYPRCTYILEDKKPMKPGLERDLMNLSSIVCD